MIKTKIKNYLTIFILLSSNFCSGQTPFSGKMDSLILKGMDYTINTQFDSAMITYQEVIDLYPEHLVGLFYQATALQSKMMDYETNEWEDLFFEKI